MSNTQKVIDAIVGQGIQIVTKKVTTRRRIVLKMSAVYGSIDLGEYPKTRERNDFTNLYLLRKNHQGQSS